MMMSPTAESVIVFTAGGVGEADGLGAGVPASRQAIAWRYCVDSARVATPIKPIMNRESPAAA
jgi:hypothetical protein